MRDLSRRRGKAVLCWRTLSVPPETLKQFGSQFGTAQRRWILAFQISLQCARVLPGFREREPADTPQRFSAIGSAFGLKIAPMAKTSNRNTYAPRRHRSSKSASLATCQCRALRNRPWISNCALELAVWRCFRGRAVGREMNEAGAGTSRVHHLEGDTTALAFRERARNAAAEPRDEGDLPQ
jgi:hypothetical protein